MFIACYQACVHVKTSCAVFVNIEQPSSPSSIEYDMTHHVRPAFLPMQAAQAAKAAEAGPRPAGPALDDDEGELDANMYHERRVASIKV